MTLTRLDFSKKFPLGLLVMTRGVNDEAAHNAPFASFVYKSLKRHALGDWGDLDAEDKAMNDQAYKVQWDPDKGGDRVFSAYESQGLPKIWIITEADRSATTVLFPDEY